MASAGHVPRSGADAPTRDDVGIRMLTSLLDEAHLAPPDRMPEVIAAAASAAAWDVSLYLVDYEQRQLVGMGPDGVDSTLSVDGSLAGRAFRDVEPMVVKGEGGRVWMPVIDGVERLGVLDVRFPADVDAAIALEDHDTRETIRLFAHLVGHVLGSKSTYGDALHRVRLRRDRTVESELIWSLLPPLTVACHGVVISGLLEPNYRVAGDVFDYSVGRDTAHAAILDATGHELRSGVIGAISLAAYRNSRRRGDDLTDTVRSVDQTLQSYEEDTYATGVFTQLDLRSGVMRYVNAGHPAPLLLRAGKVVKELDSGRRQLLGLSPTTSPTAPASAVEQLEQGDWVVLYTDGVIEARDEKGVFFGLERLIDVIERRAADREPAPETLRSMLRTIMEHQNDVLQDDATLLIIQWTTGLEEDLEARPG